MIDAARFATVILWTSIGLASVMIVAVVVERREEDRDHPVEEGKRRHVLLLDRAGWRNAEIVSAAHRGVNGD